MGLYIPGKNRPRSCEECKKTYLEIPNCPVINKMISFWGTAIGCPLKEVDDVAFGLFEAHVDDIEERKTGHWIIDGCLEMCDQCGEPRDFPHWKYCPNCGARMEGVMNEL